MRQSIKYEEKSERGEVKKIMLKHNIAKIISLILADNNSRAV